MPWSSWTAPALPEHREKAVQAHAAGTMARKLVPHVSSGTGRGDYGGEIAGIKASHPGLEYDASVDKSPWTHALEPLYGPELAADADADAVVQERVAHNVEAAGSFHAAMQEALPASRVGNTGYSYGRGSWPAAIVTWLRAKAAEHGVLDRTLADVAPATSSSSSPATLSGSTRTSEAGLPKGLYHVDGSRSGTRAGTVSERSTVAQFLDALPKVDPLRVAGDERDGAPPPDADADDLRGVGSRADHREAA